MNKALLTLLFLFAAVISHAQETKLDRYQYWLDFDHSALKEGKMNGSDTDTLQLKLDMDTVREGIHTLRVRFADTEGLWSAPLSWMFMCVPNAVNRTITGLEYWFDQNRAASHTLAMDSTTLSFVADASELKEGIHTFAYQIKDSENYWSSVSQWTFYKTMVLPADSIDAIEYWIDSDSHNIKSIVAAAGSNTFEVKADTLREGMHTLSYRTKTNLGRYSAPSSWTFYKTMVLPGDSIDAIEYWMDSDSHNIKSIVAAAGNNTFEVKADTLREGMHTFSYRTKTNLGRYSAPSSWTFYKTTVQPTDSIDAIEYWVDSLYTQKVTIPAMSGTNTFQIETSELKEGMHTLSYRVRTNLGRYSSAGIWMFFKTSETPLATGIKWYRYWWNDRTDMAVTEELDSVTQTYALNCQLTLPDYARTGFADDALTTRLTVVFGDDVGGVSAPVFADVKFPDINPPVSQIEVDKTMAYTSVNISWSGTDEELKDFNIYVSENDLPFVLWLPNTTATSAVFKGETGKVYRFTVTARDKSDNVEKFDEEKCVKVRFNQQ